MPYTLVKFLVWAIAFFGIGVFVGWLLRALKARGEVAAARRTAASVDTEVARREPADEEVVDADADPDADAGERSRHPAMDLDEARAVLGAPIELDDLTVVDGVGPKIAELCAGVGITTWRELADADPATLRDMLDDAGSRFRVHDPTTWSHQASLLADGRWSEFVAYNDELTGDS